MPFVRHQTLTPATVATFTVTGNPSAVEIISRNGLAEVYVSYAGQVAGSTTDPTVGGNDFDAIPAAVGAGIVIREIGNRDDMVVKLISSGATSVSVRGVQ